MQKLIKIATLKSQLEGAAAEYRGIKNLAEEGGYEDSMDGMYTPDVKGDNPDNFAFQYMPFDTNLKVADITKAPMAVWIAGRLYDSELVNAYKFEGVDGLWVVDDEEAEWNA